MEIRYNKLLEFVSKHNGELNPDLSRARVIGERVVGARLYACFPSEPGPTVKAAIRDFATDIDIVIGLKPSTLRMLEGLIGQRVSFKALDRHVEAEVKEDIGEVWDKVCEALRNDGYAESWRIGSLVWDPKVAKAVEERPQRNAPIDLIDVQIEINELEMLMNQPKE